MKRKLILVVSLLLLVSLGLAACQGGAEPAVTTEAPAATQTEHEAEEEEHEEEGEHDEGQEEDEHMEDDHMDEHSPDEHMGGEHDVPEEASELQNPLQASEESVSVGADLYAENCAVCHGENGEGDGPAAASLDPAPSDLHEDHVQELTDGGLYYIISHGRPETAMPAWEDTLSEDERWHIVNFLRTFEE